MSRIGTWLVAVAILVSPVATSAASRHAPEPAPTQGPYVPRQVIVGFRPDVTPPEFTTVERSVGALRIRRMLMPHTELLSVPQSTTVSDVMRRLEAEPAVQYAEANSLATVAATPNDPLYGQQWALPKIGAPGAWDVSTGDRAVEVGVADSGIEAADPDLSANTAPTQGWNFVTNSAGTQDDVYHGTFVASAIGAVGNDGYAMAGVNWESTMIPLKVCSLRAISSSDPPVTCSAAAQADAFAWAGQHGIPIVNASFNSGTFSQTVYNAIAGSPKTLFVAAAGNQTSNLDLKRQYPCDYGHMDPAHPSRGPSLPNVLCVAATDQQDSLASFSNYGSSTVDLAAPGQAIVGAYPYVSRYRETFGKSLSGRWTTGNATSANTWVRTCPGAWCYLGDVPNGQGDTWAQSVKPINTMSGTTCQLQFRLKGILAGGDQLIASASSDTTSWSPVLTWSGTTSGRWTSAYADLSAFDQRASVYLRFDMQANTGVGTDSVGVDTVTVSCHPAPGTFAGTENQSRNGTSYAAAYVSGAAALVLAKDPSATVAQLKSAILQGGDSVSALQSSTVSGRRLNVNGALAQVP